MTRVPRCIDASNGQQRSDKRLADFTNMVGLATASPIISRRRREDQDGWAVEAVRAHDGLIEPNISGHRA